MFNQLETHFGAQKKWNSLDRAYVNFTHWTFVKGDHESVPYQKNGFYVSWLRHNAYICQDRFPSIDLVIPMAFPNDKYVTPDCMSCIVISVKNCEDTEGIETKTLSKEAVEGVIAKKNCDNNDNKHKINEVEVRDKANANYTHYDRNLDIKLTLNAVKFINPGGVACAVDDDERWIEPSESKPYIAFAMSIGQTERKVDLFIAEEVSFHPCSSHVLGY